MAVHKSAFPKATMRHPFVCPNLQNTEAQLATVHCPLQSFTLHCAESEKNVSKEESGGTQSANVHTFLGSAPTPIHPAFTAPLASQVYFWQCSSPPAIVDKNQQSHGALAGQC